MKFCKIFYLLIIFNMYFVYCTPVTKNDEISENGERIIKLELENSELRLENARLKLEIVHLKQENNATSILMNMLPTLNNFTENVNALSLEVKPFKEYFNKVIDDVSNNNLKSKIPEENEIKVKSLPKNCDEASNGISGVYTIELPNSGLESFPVVCDAETHYGGWTLVQQRVNGLVGFYRPWAEYKAGFGTISVIGEFFIGLEKLHQLTQSEPYELLVVLEDFNNVTKYAYYDKLVIGSEAEKYSLKELGSYFGTAGDSLNDHRGKEFSTFDADNDSGSGNCAELRKGAWWYNDCTYSNLNGIYYLDGKIVRLDSMNWLHFHGDRYSLKKSQMMIRPKSVLASMCKQFIKN